MNELQILKTGYIRCLRTALAILFAVAGAALEWLQPVLLVHPFFFAAAAVIVFPVIRDAFFALSYKKLIAKVHGRQTFFRTFFAGESLLELHLQAAEAKRDVRDLRMQATHDCGYSEKEFEQLFRRHGFRDTTEILMETHERLERKCRDLVMRGVAAGIGPHTVQSMLLAYGTEETQSRIAAVEQGVAGGLSPADMLDLLQQRGLPRTWMFLKEFDLLDKLLTEAQKLGCYDVILTAARQFGYGGAEVRLKEITRSVRQRVIQE